MSIYVTVTSGSDAEGTSTFDEFFITDSGKISEIIQFLMHVTHGEESI